MKPRNRAMNFTSESQPQITKLRFETQLWGDWQWTHNPKLENAASNSQIQNSLLDLTQIQCALNCFQIVSELIQH